MSPELFSVFVFIAFAIPILAQENDTDHGTVIFYEDSYHRGEKWTAYVEKDQCHNFQKYFNDKVSSLNTQDHCILLFEHGDCKGGWERFAPTTPNHEDLAVVKFNDKASSFRLCPEVLRVRVNATLPTEIRLDVQRCRMVCE